MVSFGVVFLPLPGPIWHDGVFVVLYEARWVRKDTEVSFSILGALEVGPDLLSSFAFSVVLGDSETLLPKRAYRRWNYFGLLIKQ